MDLHKQENRDDYWQLRSLARLHTAAVNRPGLIALGWLPFATEQSATGASLVDLP